MILQFNIVFLISTIKIFYFLKKNFYNNLPKIKIININYQLKKIKMIFLKQGFCV